MKDKRIIGIFAVVLIVTSIMKLLGLSLRPIIDGYVMVATTIMQWFAPEIFSEAYPSSIQTLIILVPFILIATLTSAIIRLTEYRKKANQQLLPNIRF